MLREDEVRGYAARHPGRVPVTKSLLKSADAKKNHDVFLSHASVNASLVVDVAAWLRDQGLRVYVDTDEGDLSTLSMEDVARALRLRINESRRVVVVATNEAVSSGWVVWELGLADGMKGPDGVVLLPLKDDFGEWDGREYLRLYPHIWRAKEGGWGVFPPGSNQGKPLSSLQRMVTIVIRESRS